MKSRIPSLSPNVPLVFCGIDAVSSRHDGEEAKSQEHATLDGNRARIPGFGWTGAGDANSSRKCGAGAAVAYCRNHAIYELLESAVAAVKFDKRSDVYTLSTGRQVYAHCGLISVGPRSIGNGLALYEGFDGTVNDSDDDVPFTTAERAEIADHMIRTWNDWKSEGGSALVIPVTKT